MVFLLLSRLALLLVNTVNPVLKIFWYRSVNNVANLFYDVVVSCPLQEQSIAGPKKHLLRQLSTFGVATLPTVSSATHTLPTQWCLSLIIYRREALVLPGSLRVYAACHCRAAGV